MGLRAAAAAILDFGSGFDGADGSLVVPQDPLLVINLSKDDDDE
jgi:hypothetical protein